MTKMWKYEVPSKKVNIRFHSHTTTLLSKQKSTFPIDKESNKTIIER